MNRKVLIVDDDPNLLHALGRVLGERFEVSCAEGGQPALESLDAAGPFAAIVADMCMPGMSGLDLLREVRRRAPATVRLILTGHGDFTTAVAAINDGAVFRFHRKPIRPEDLADSLECALVRHVAEKAAGGWITPDAGVMNAVAEIRRGFAEKRFRIYLQPQQRLDDRRITGAEVLVRLDHPEHGLLPPSAFLPTLAAAGLGHELTRWALDAACAEGERLRAAGWSDLTLAVNTDAQDFFAPGFAARVLEILAWHGLPGDGLELELTEGTALADPAGTGEIIRDLATHGVVTSIDDFGSGHSALGWLAKLPVSKVKIDKSFIDNLAPGNGEYHLVECIVGVGRKLGFDVLAEGIETAPQLDLVRRAGCRLVQGYFVAPPMPVETFDSWLRRFHA